jgi:hypothetical protein
MRFSVVFRNVEHHSFIDKSVAIVTNEEPCPM